MRVSKGPSFSDNHEFLNAGFRNIRAGYLKHKDIGATMEALFSKLNPRSPIPFMVFQDSGNCRPAGISFCELFIHEDAQVSKVLAGCLIQAIARVKLSYDLQDKLVLELINVIDKSRKGDHAGLIEVKNRLLTLLPKQKQLRLVA